MKSISKLVAVLLIVSFTCASCEKEKSTPSSTTTNSNILKQRH